MPRLLVASAVILAVVAAGAPARAQTFVPSDEDRVHSMVNATRAAHGLPPLIRLEGLVTLARQHSVRMVQQDNLFHNLNLKTELDSLGLGWAWSGENVGVGPTVDAVQEAFLNSAHHYENIVRPNYNALGIGVVEKSNGYRYVTQVFADIRSVGATPPPPTPAPPTPPPPPQAPVEPPPTAAPTPVPTPEPAPVHIAIEGGIVVQTVLFP